LAHAAALVPLDLRGVLVRHLDELPLPAETCARLETLALWDAGLTTLDGLARFPRLRRLHVPRAKLRSIEPQAMYLTQRAIDPVSRQRRTCGPRPVAPSSTVCSSPPTACRCGPSAARWA